MGKLVGIFGMSGDGKTTSTIVNPDGKYDFSKDGYKGMNPETHYIINLDKKELPFPAGMWSAEKKNYAVISDFRDIKACIEALSKSEKIKSVSLDTLNVYLSFKEFNDRKKMTFDQWRDVANDIIELTELCNNVLRADQIAYIMGHVELITDVDGNEKKVLSVIGKKSKRQMPEGFFPICLFTSVEYGNEGDNKFTFQTKAARSSAKTPIGMFDKFSIPNSLALVDATIRKYYNI
jgi:hypothetical protein